MMDAKTSFDRYFKGSKEFDFPKRVIVELTDRCNLSCKMCPRRHLKLGRGFMQLALYKKIIDEMAGHPGTGLIPFFRGEALLHPDFLVMLKYAVSKGIAPIQLATNATCLSDNMSRAIIKSGLDFISFSLDAPTPELYDKIRIGSDYHTVTKNIDDFLLIKKGLGLEKPVVQVSMVETGTTKPYAAKFISAWKNKVDRVRIYKEHSGTVEFGRLRQKSVSRAPSRKPCLKVLTEMVIYWDGGTAICNHDWDNRIFSASLKKSSIKEIWLSGQYHKLRKDHYRATLPGDSCCAKCDQWKAYYSRSGLIGRLITASGKGMDI